MWPYLAAAALLTSTLGAQPPLREPAFGEELRFDDLGTKVTRASNAPHHYAKTSPWNADESLVLTNDGWVLDGRTFVPLRRIPLPSEHKVWSNVDPHHVYGANRAARQWVRVDATTGETTVLATYPGWRSVSFGDYEGNLDDDDRSAVLVGDGRIPFVVDAPTGVLRCTVERGGGFGRAVSDATMSHDGRWALVHWESYGIDAYRAADCRFHRRLSRSTGHYDACVSAEGDQVIVQETSPIGMTRIADGARSNVYSDSVARAHVSCRNTRRPGWAYLSHDNEVLDAALRRAQSFHQIFAVRLDGSGATEVFAWDHSPAPVSYAGSPMACPSRSGDRVWWKADWDGRAGAVRSYVATRPP